jgi:ComF family protein
LPFALPGGPALSAAALIDPPVHDRCRAVARYGGTMRRLIKDLKFRDRHDGRALFGRWLVEAGGPLVAEADAVVPVPLTPVRLALRRFNQAAILAREISRRTRLPYLPGALVRTRRTRPQPGLTREERKANVRGAFAVPAAARPALRGRAILLVDDVVTTGATVEACALALKSAGAARVDVLALGLVTDTVLTPD